MAKPKKAKGGVQITFPRGEDPVRISHDGRDEGRVFYSSNELPVVIVAPFDEFIDMVRRMHPKIRGAATGMSDTTEPDDMNRVMSEWEMDDTKSLIEDAAILERLVVVSQAVSELMRLQIAAMDKRHRTP